MVTGETGGRERKLGEGKRQKSEKAEVATFTAGGLHLGKMEYNARVSVWLFRPGQPIITLATKEKEPMEIENEKGKSGGEVNCTIAKGEREHGVQQRGWTVATASTPATLR